MLSKTHVVIGLTYGAALMPSVARQELTAVHFGCVVAGLAVGSLLPDLDHPQSAINRKIPIFGGILGRLFAHRGILHSILGILGWLVFLSFVAAVVSQALPAAHGAIAHIISGLIIGYILHILADSFTKSGVRLLYPLKFNVGFKLIKTGGKAELITRWVLIGLCVLQILYLIF